MVCGKLHGGRVDEAADEAVGQAGDGVRLVGQGGDAQQDRGHHRRTGGVAAHADDDGGRNPEQADAAQMPRGRSPRVRRRVTRLTFLSWPTWISSSWKPASGTSFVSSPRAVPTKRTSAPCGVAQLPRDRQRRDDVAPGASARNQDPQHRHGSSRSRG